MPSDQVIDTLTHQWPCRDAQIQRISALLSPNRPGPSIVILHGTTSTGKSSIIQAYLTKSKLSHVYLACAQCITERHLFERALTLVTQSVATDRNTILSNSSKCENASNLQSALSPLLKDQEKFILVLDGIDELEDRSMTLLPALSRMTEKIPSLILVFLIRSTVPRLLKQTGIPQISFPPYTREESIHIVSQKPLDIFLELSPTNSRYNATAHEEDKRWLWPRFVSAVWDSLGQSAARSLSEFTTTCNKLWRPFIEPIVQGNLGTRDFSRLMVAQRGLFQHDSVLLDSILAPESEDQTVLDTNMQHDIPHYAQWLLTAAFLASMNPSRLDGTYFMKSTDKKRRKKGASMVKSIQQRRVPRHLLQPSPFTLERLIAITQAILPDKLRGSIDIHTQLATLKSLRFLSQAASYGSGDTLEAGGKWRTGPAITFEFVSSLCGALDFSLGDYLAV